MNVKQQIARQIQQVERPILICHVSPDGDALGSLLGLAIALRKLGKRPEVTCQDAVPATFQFLPCADQVISQPNGQYDLIIGLDSSDERRLGTPYQRLAGQGLPLINIDHHVTNLRFGHLNWVDENAVATAEIVLELIDLLDIPLDPDLSTCLLAGLVTDTRGFRTSNTSAQVMAAVTRLMEAGASLAEITHQVFHHRPLAVVRMWNRAFSETYLDGAILWSVVTKTMRADSNYDINGDAGLVSFLSEVNEADIAVVFTEKNEGEIDVGIRANPGFDVSQVALSLGGGGHPQAAGCTLKTSLQGAIETVLPSLQLVWREQAGH